MKNLSNNKLLAYVLIIIGVLIVFGFGRIPGIIRIILGLGIIIAGSHTLMRSRK